MSNNFNLLSNNLLKRGYANLQDGERRVINSNELAARRIEELAEKMTRPENDGFMKDGDAFLDDSEDGFSEGLSAEQVEGLLSDDESDDGVRSNVIKAERPNNANRETLINDAVSQAQEIVNNAKEQAEAQAQEILAEAKARADREYETTLSEAREQGYQEGLQKAQKELEQKEHELSEHRKAIDTEYEELVKGLEPRFVDAITEVYERLFAVELSSYRDILIHLIAAAIKNIEGGKDFLIHVSQEDYPYVSMEKKQLTSALASPNATLELVEDSSLAHNECMIETDSGIFDCGLGTQLAELKQRLKLLSYEGAAYQ